MTDGNGSEKQGLDLLFGDAADTSGWSERIRFDVTPWPVLRRSASVIRMLRERSEALTEKAEALKKEIDELADMAEDLCGSYCPRIETFVRLNGIEEHSRGLLRFDTDRMIPPGEKKRFKAVIGTPFTAEDLAAVEDPTRYITVGDETSKTFYEAGVVPALSIYDGRTRRDEPSEFGTMMDGRRRLRVVNPAGTISAKLVEAIVSSFNGSGRLIEVFGEEDLAALPCIALAPEGSVVVYGEPGVGMRAVAVNDAERERAIELMDSMQDLKARLFEKVDRVGTVDGIRESMLRAEEPTDSEKKDEDEDEDEMKTEEGQRWRTRCWRR